MVVQVAIVSQLYGGARARLAYNVIRAYSGVCGLHVGCYGCVFVGDFVLGWSGPRIDVDVVPGSDRGIKFQDVLLIYRRTSNSLEGADRNERRVGHGNK